MVKLLANHGADVRELLGSTLPKSGEEWRDAIGSLGAIVFTGQCGGHYIAALRVGSAFRVVDSMGPSHNGRVVRAKVEDFDTMHALAHRMEQINAGHGLRSVLALWHAGRLPRGTHPTSFGYL